MLNNLNDVMDDISVIEKTMQQQEKRTIDLSGRMF